MDVLRWFLHTRIGVPSTKLIPVLFPQKHFFDEDSHRNCYGALLFHKSVVKDIMWEKVAQMLADLLRVEMFQAAVAGIMISMTSAFESVSSR